MSASYPGAFQVGSYFVGQYYQVLRQQPDLVHQFYTDASSIIRVDGDSSESASSMMQIHTLAMSLNFTAIEIKTINSLDSWNGGVLVMVSGSVKIKDFNGRRKFVQTFFLAPQEKGYFVLNDIFQFIGDEIVYQHPASTLQEDKLDSKHQALLQSHQEEISEYVNSVHIEDYPDEKYGVSEQSEQEDVEDNVAVSETRGEETLVLHHSVVDTVQEPPALPLVEPVEEPPRRTYASILSGSKQKSASSVPVQHSYNKVPPSTSDWDHTPEFTSQQSHPAWSDVPESPAETTVEEALVFEEGEYTGEYKSVYVRNLPPTVTATEIEQEFRNFGKIKPGGVFVRIRKDVVGVCYAFVEFEDILAVQNAIKASPIQFAGRQVYIEERRPNSSSTRGGRRGRGRGRYPHESSRGRTGSRSFGRGNDQESGDYRSRSNGFYQRGSR